MRYEIACANELYHHGIKGQRWGIRRYQNPDGTLTRAGRRKAAKTYDYRKSDAYKKGTRGERQRLSNQHRNNVKAFGRSAANKIDYAVHVEGKSANKEKVKTFAKQAVAAAAVTTAITLGPDAYRLGKAYIKRGNLAATKIGRENGYNTVKGGFSTGFGGIKRGKEVVERARSYTAGTWKNAKPEPRVALDYARDAKYRWR